MGEPDTFYVTAASRESYQSSMSSMVKLSILKLFASKSFISKSSMLKCSMLRSFIVDIIQDRRRSFVQLVLELALCAEDLF
jgi:hypothetical protein